MSDTGRIAPVVLDCLVSKRPRARSNLWFAAITCRCERRLKATLVFHCEDLGGYLERLALLSRRERAPELG